MGLFLSNLHIKKNENIRISELVGFLTDDMKSKGYTQVDTADEAEVVLAIYAPENSQWISVSSDCYNFNDDNDTRSAAEPISGRFGAYVLAVGCMDGDYGFLHLINTSKKADGWINLGSPYEGMKLPRRTSLSPWKNAVSDFDKFSAVAKEKNVFAEAALFSAAKLLSIDAEQCALEADRTEWLSEEYLTKLYFRFPEGTKKELPKLRAVLSSSLPCRSDVNQVMFVNNKGGRSKGVAVMFVGDYIENDDVEIYNATFESDYGSEKRKRVPITFEKRKTADGKYILWWEDRDFQIPPAVNPALPVMKRMDLEFKKQFGVRFFVKGDPEKFPDVEVRIIPLENAKEGYDFWKAQKRLF